MSHIHCIHITLYSASSALIIVMMPFSMHHATILSLSSTYIKYRTDYAMHKYCMVYSVYKQIM